MRLGGWRARHVGVRGTEHQTVWASQ
jgi:hypothetical protein